MLKLILTLTGLSVSFCFGQTLLKGSVFADSLNTPLPNVQASIPELNVLVLSDSEGIFTLKGLPNGYYNLELKLAGYKTKILPIHLQDTLNLGGIVLYNSSVKFDEIVIVGTANSDIRENPNSILQLFSDDIRNSGAINLSDGISKLPGVSQLSTGAGISKPVIRGLFGNRIQTVLYGLRFDNQQWQDEHGMGLSDVGIDRVEVIKGAASLLYGSEAMGGVINIIEEKPAPVNSVNSDFSARFYSNTYGIANDAGVKAANEKLNWRIRLGFDSHADYSDGNDKRVLNSRFGGYYAKAGLGFNRKKWINQTNYMFTQSNFGFLMDPIQLLDPPDSRLSRSFDRPHHTVNLNILSSQNTFFLNNSKLKLNIGFQNNHRQEQEGGNKISLDMILNSYIGNVVWTKTFNEKIEWSVGSQGYLQTNKNIGSRTIIPDAFQVENSVYSYLKYNLKRIDIEGGIRYDNRFIQTFATGSINTDPLSPGYLIKPMSKNFNAINGSIGFCWFNEEHLNFKSNISSGYRAGNLSELSSNGLHEGTVRYEIGNTDMKIEQNICSDVYFSYDNSWLTTSFSAYYNQFFNYIYLAPTDKQYIGFQIYNYMQQDAVIKGIEANLNIHPLKHKWISWTNSYSYILGNLNNGENLPFIPAPKLNSDIKFSYRTNKKISEINFKPGVTYCFAQNRPGNFETNTSDYYLLNASIAMIITKSKTNIQISLIGINVLNNVYYDHLSRFKYFGIYNVGRNISLNFKITFK